MSYTYLQEQGEVSSVDSYSDIPQSVLLKLRSTQEMSCSNDNETGCCLSSPSGTTSVPSTEPLGGEQLMLFAEDFPARTLVQREKEPVLEESVLDYGKNMHELLAKYGLNLSSRKTPRYCGVAALTLSSETCPNWGMMQDGACWELGTSAHPIKEIGCGYLPKLAPTPRAQEPGSTSEGYGDCLNDVAKGRKGWDQMWPTPTRRDYKGTNSPEGLTRKDGKSRMDQLPNAVKYRTPQSRDWKGTSGGFQKGKDFPGQVGGHLNPAWVEWLMGWPVEWTELKPLEMGKYQQWQQQHGIF